MRLAAFAAMLLLLFSCVRPSVVQTELETQKRQWVTEYKEAFPEKTSDTTELKKRLAYFNETGNKIGRLMMCRVLGNEARASSQFRAAIEYHTTGLQLAYELNDTLNITVVMNDLATNFRRIGAFDEAAPYHYLALQIAEQYRGPDTLLIERNMASAYNGIGSICRAMNEYDEAIRVYDKALELEVRHNNNRGIAINQANIGAVHFAKQEYARAENYYRLSLENNERAKQPMGIALCRINIGEIYEVQGRSDDALKEYEQAYSELAGTTDKWHWLDACFAIANIHLSGDRFAQAASYLEEGLLTARRINSMKHLWKAHELYATYHYARGDFRRAADDMRSTQAYADTMQHNLEVDRMLESRVKYETDRYTRQIEDLDRINHEQTVRSRNTILLLSPLLAVLSGAVLLLIYKRRLERRQAVQLKNLERMRSNFFTNITHEFRNPITVINGLAAHLLTNHEDSGSPQARDLDAICRSGERMMHLVNQLLEFSRSEAGVNKPKWRHGDMVEYIKALAEPYSQYARSKGVELFVYSEPESLPMNFVPSSVKKVMANLLSNAIRHCGAGDRIIVHFRYDKAVRKCYIQVKDSGEGITPENLPRIFELYYTSGAENSGSTGSGIGLALSKQLVEEIGGTIAVASTPGKGAEFTVSLPVSNASIPESEREAPDEEESAGLSAAGIIPDGSSKELAAQPETNDGRKTVLIVEDNKDVAHYISTVLSGEYALLHASNGNEGLRMAEQHVPDLIVTDVMMPEKNGYEFTADLRNSIAVSHIPVIMITALGETENKLEGLKAGADAYLPKPFDERELRVRVKQLLDSRAMLMEAYSGALLNGGFGNAGAGNIAAHDKDFITRLSLTISSHIDDDTYFPVKLSQEMCLSTSQLNRKLKAMTGGTISSFVMDVRLNRAKLLLSKGGQTIKEVAFACGFSDLGYFSRSFKNAFGCTPSQFLKTGEI